MAMRKNTGHPMSNFSQRKLVSVIIPARDEANSIVSLIHEIKENLSRYPYEVIVVDDGSRDATKEVAQSSATLVVSHEKNLGKGAAMKTGVENARGDIIVFLDGDKAYSPQDIPGLIAPILRRKADLVLGSRTIPGAKVPTSPLVRRLSNNLASLVISAIISLLLPLVTRFRCPAKWTKITDCTGGFRAIRRRGWHKLDLTSQGFQIETEMIYEAARNGLTIAEAPVSCNWNRELSHLSILRDGLKTLKLLAGKLIGDIRK